MKAKPFGSLNQFTLIINYFVNGTLMNEIRNYGTAEKAYERVKELRSQGIEIDNCHFGIYEWFIGDKLIEIESFKDSA